MGFDQESVLLDIDIAIPHIFAWFFVFICLLAFGDKFSLCSPGWTQTYDPPVSASG